MVEAMEKWRIGPNAEGQPRDLRLFNGYKQVAKVYASDFSDSEGQATYYANMIVDRVYAYDTLLDTLGQLGVTQERIVTLEKALKAIADHDGSRWFYEDGAVTTRQPSQRDIAAAALCDHRGDCTHIEAKQGSAKIPGAPESPDAPQSTGESTSHESP